MSFQSFEATTSPQDGPARLARLREKMAQVGLDAFVVPRADAHQGEHVAPCDDRLAWLTGFTGSAGFAVVLAKEAGVFIDGRYTVQVRSQVDTAHFTPVPWPKTKPGDWVADRLGKGARLGFDPWLHTAEAIEALEKRLSEAGIETVPTDNLVDAVWEGRPGRPAAPLFAYPEELAGETAADKQAALAEALRDAGQSAAVLTLPDSIAWALNIRGGDIPRTPIAHAWAILRDDASVILFCDSDRGAVPDGHMGNVAAVHSYGELTGGLDHLEGAVRIDRSSAPFAIWSHLAARRDAGQPVEPVAGDDPCALPKAKKTPAEIAATSEAHLRDGAAMAEFLAWLDAEAPKGALTEIDVVEKLETCRRATDALRDISFDTIAGAGPHGAIVHYRVTRETNRPVRPGELLLVDSGGQYLDGTTDITRTIAIGMPTDEQRACFTRVLQGMIAISRARWPRGLTGRDLDPLARAPLWMAGQDFDHGTGHGVGVYLSVHEGPQGLSRRSKVPLEPGMILSNEPGYYREGAFGIRIENLLVVEEAPSLDGGDDRDQLAFRTLTFAPIDRRLIDETVLAPAERAWLNSYHEEVDRLISPRVTDSTRRWLAGATRPV